MTKNFKKQDGTITVKGADGKIVGNIGSDAQPAPKVVVAVAGSGSAVATGVFRYMYRDASNYKDHGSVSLDRPLTAEEIQRIEAVLEDGDSFIPEQVGLYSFAGDGRDDHCWHVALFEESMGTYPDYPNIDMAAADLVAAFEAVTKWDDGKYARGFGNFGGPEAEELECWECGEELDDHEDGLCENCEIKAGDTPALQDPKNDVAAAPDLTPYNSIACGISAGGDVLVEWVDLGEGLDGDYDEENPEDVSLLRFDADVRGRDSEYNDRMGLDVDDQGWGARAQNSSYCTQVPAGTAPATLKRLAEKIANELDDNLDSGGWKQAGERLSWVGPMEIDITEIELRPAPSVPLPEVKPMYGYICSWGDKRVEVYASTMSEAQGLAVTELQKSTRKKVKASDVRVFLAEKDGETVVHIPDF